MAERASSPPDPQPDRPVGRLAPSPTGYLHLGHARSFLLAWWHVRARGGRIVLRIEDLDAERSKPELVDACVRDLEWLGLDWDGEPVLQSANTAAIQAAAERLRASGQVYPCVCTRREIALSAPHPGEGETRYPGTCRERFPDAESALAATGRQAGWRLRVAPGPVEVLDRLRGRVAFDVSAEVGDFLVVRRDGAFAYQLAVVADDARDGVTEVLRGDDLLASAARQILLQRALGFSEPEWIHVPLVVDPSGRRLAKRSGDLALASLRERGVDPRAVVAWAARSSGQLGGQPGGESDRQPGGQAGGESGDELVTAAELVSAFDLERLPTETVALAEASVRAWPRA